MVFVSLIFSFLVVGACTMAIKWASSMATKAKNDIMAEFKAKK